MEKEELFKKLIIDRANRAYNSGVYTFTPFLDMYQSDVVHSLESKLNFVPVTFFGGKADCERLMVRFGDEEMMGYDEHFPIDCIKISPLLQKFADKLSHRDFLGALMNLGIERDTMGDIVIRDNMAFLFCQTNMSDFIIRNLDKVKHTSVKCEKCVYSEDENTEQGLEQLIQVSSPRLDAMIAKTYNFSRELSAQTIIAQKVFVNGRLNENVSAHIKEGDIISVRGKGRFTVLSLSGMSKKGKYNIMVEKFN